MLLLIKKIELHKLSYELTTGRIFLQTRTPENKSAKTLVFFLKSYKHMIYYKNGFRSLSKHSGTIDVFTNQSKSFAICVYMYLVWINLSLQNKNQQSK